MSLVVVDQGSSLMVEFSIRPEVRAASSTELPPDLPPAEVGMLPGDECIVAAGGLQGQRGLFTRDKAGTVVGIELAGRFFGRLQR